MSSVVLRSIASATSHDAGSAATHLLARADADMRHVLEVWAAMAPRPLEDSTVPEARAQPTLAMALGQILRDLPDEGGVSMEMRMIPGAAGDLRARVYAPAGGAHGLPLILYLHGGGWVVGDFPQFDATPRALARKVRAVVVASHYRQAPEFRFPAAHEDAHAAWRWMLANAAALGGDPARTAIVGEDAGASMAIDVALAARGTEVKPKHLGLIEPMASTDFGLPSYGENADSRPLGAAGVRWFYLKALGQKSDRADPRLNLIDRADLAGLPPATVILAGLDPLRSEGELLADALRRAGVWVDATTYDGVTHGFLGLARVVNKAMFAQGQLVRNLLDSLAPRQASGSL